jgi:TonB family protein
VGLGAPAVPETDASGDLPRRDPAGVKPSPGVGVLRGPVGADHRPAAAVATGRPWVPAGPEAFVAEEKGPAADRMNSEQEVAATIQSLVHASTAGGVPGSGQGGEEAPGYSGSGGPAGPGSRAAPFGAGAGPFTAVLDDDPRVSNYWRRVQGKIDAQWDERSFPRWASLEGRQGWAVISFVILADGRVGDLRIARPSGVPEFDENVRRAVQRAAPFEPPPAIAAASKRWSITFDARNPAVR